MRLPTLLLLTTTVIAGCEEAECESSLVLHLADDASTQLIDDGCTSLIVDLPVEADGGTWSDPLELDEAVLRFDYRDDGEELSSFYFTPVGSGETELALDLSLDGEVVDSWSITLTVDYDFD